MHATIFSIFQFQWWKHLADEVLSIFSRARQSKVSRLTIRMSLTSQRDIISIKPDTLVRERGPPNLRRNPKHYLDRLDRGTIATNECRKSIFKVSICQCSIISLKPDTLVDDRGPPTLRRNSKNYLHCFDRVVISTS